MRKIVLKRNNTNIVLCSILFGVIFGIVVYPVGIYLLNIGLRPLHSNLVGILAGHLTAWILLNLTVKIEPAKPEVRKGVFAISLIVFNATGFFAVYVGVALREIIPVCAGALLIVSLWTSVFLERRKTRKRTKEIENGENLVKDYRFET